MQNQSTFSTNKIIFSVFFICAALMTSVLVFHARQKLPATVVPAEYGLLFPAPREIKTFELLTADHKAFTQQDLLNHWTLLFFGFTHCTSICPATLDIMNRAYPTLHKLNPSLQVIMISLDPERDSADTVSTYAQGFNPVFKGVTGNIQEIRKLQAQFGIHSERDSTNADYQLQHTPSILLINPQGKWVGIFKYNLQPDVFAQVVTDSVNALA